MRVPVRNWVGKSNERERANPGKMVEKISGERGIRTLGPTM